MQYELYLDVQIITDLGMDLLLLALTAKILKISATYRRLFAAAAVGALAHTAVLILVIRTGQRGWTLLAVFAAAIMLKTAFSIKRWKMLGKAVAVFYGTAFLLSGAVQYVNPRQRRTLIRFLISSLAGYGMLLVLYRIFLWYKRRHGNIYPVRLYIGDEVFCLKGLVDTGNSLTDPWFHKPVNIVERSMIKDMEEESLQKLKLHMIPYNSIGKQNGVLMGIVITRMVIEAQEGERTVEEPVLAVSQSPVSSDGRYQMILHEECMHSV